MERWETEKGRTLAHTMRFKKGVRLVVPGDYAYRYVLGRGSLLLFFKNQSPRRRWRGSFCITTLFLGSLLLVFGLL